MTYRIILYGQIYTRPLEFYSNDVTVRALWKKCLLRRVENNPRVLRKSLERKKKFGYENLVLKKPYVNNDSGIFNSLFCYA